MPTDMRGSRKTRARTRTSCPMTMPRTAPGLEVTLVSRALFEPMIPATAPVTPSPTNIQRKTRWRKFDSSRATSTGCAAYSISGEAYGNVATALRFRGLDAVELLGEEVAVASGLRSRLLGLALLPRELVPAGLL